MKYRASIGTNKADFIHAAIISNGLKHFKERRRCYAQEIKIFPFFHLNFTDRFYSSVRFFPVPVEEKKELLRNHFSFDR